MSNFKRKKPKQKIRFDWGTPKIIQKLEGRLADKERYQLQRKKKDKKYCKRLKGPHIFLIKDYFNSTVFYGWKKEADSYWWCTFYCEACGKKSFTSDLNLLELYCFIIKNQIKKLLRV